MAHPDPEADSSGLVCGWMSITHDVYSCWGCHKGWKISESHWGAQEVSVLCLPDQASGQGFLESQWICLPFTRSRTWDLGLVSHVLALCLPMWLSCRVGRVCILKQNLRVLCGRSLRHGDQLKAREGQEEASTLPRSPP